MVTNKDIKALDEFLENRGISYVLTGTAALFYQGAMPKGTEVHDIDIIVPTNSENRSALQAAFRELEKLSGCQHDNDHYKQSVYVFKVGTNNTKVNVFEGKWENLSSCCSSMNIDGTTILVHGVLEVLKAKFALRREKDADFCFKFIDQLCSTFLCSKK